MPRQYTGRIPNATCPVCQRVFHVKPSHLTKRVYCSMACFHRALAAEPVICRSCGVPFKARGLSRKFCSLPCAYAHRTRTVADRLWEKVDRSGGPDACWPWLAKRDRAGYGKIGTVGTQQTHASRVAWIVTHGEIAPDLHVCHACDNPPCCNPAHLFIGDRKDNMADAVRKGRMAHGTRLPQSKLTPERVRDIRRRVAAGEVQRRLAEEYGVSPAVICNVVKRETWRHVD